MRSEDALYIGVNMYSEGGGGYVSMLDRTPNLKTLKPELQTIRP